MLEFLNLFYFLAEGSVADVKAARIRQSVRKQVPMHLLTAKQARAGKENAYRQTFIYQTKQAIRRGRKN